MGIAKQERDYQGLQVCHVRHRDHMQITQKKLEVPSLVVFLCFNTSLSNVKIV